MIMLIIPLLGYGVGALAGLLGSWIQRKQSRSDIDRQNEYNSPVNQLARLREAGLPMAAMGNNVASTQSSLPETTDGGVAETGKKLGDYIIFQTQEKQLQILEEQRRKAEAEADITENMRDWENTTDTTRFADNVETNVTRRENAKLNTIELDKWMKDNQKQLSDMDYIYQEGLYEDGKMREKFDAELERLIESNKILKMQVKNEEDMTAVKQRVYDAMQSGKFPSFKDILWMIAMGVTRPSNFKFN